MQRRVVALVLLGLLCALAPSTSVQAASPSAAMAAPKPQPAAQTSSAPPSASYRSGGQVQAPSPRTPRVPSAPSWSWKNPLPNGNSLFAISCPTASTCFAAGQDGSVHTTANAGVSWSEQAVTTSLIDGLSCASASACVGVGNSGVVIRTTDGANWTSQYVAGLQFLAAVSCPTTSLCVAVGSLGAIRVTADGGATWSTRSSGTTSPLFGVSCPSVSICYAVGAAGVITGTSNGGSTWTLESSPTSVALTAISCPDTASCTAVGAKQTIVSTTNSGATWSASGWAFTVDLFGVSCPSVNQCLAAGVDGRVYFGFGAAYGSASVGASGPLWAISCPTATECLTVGSYGTVAVTNNGGSGWSLAAGALPANVNGIACPSATTCFAIMQSQGIVETTDGGTTWPQVFTPAAAIFLSSISCPSTSVCFVASSGNTNVNDPTMYRTADGGATWQPLIGSHFDNINCPTVTTCVGVQTTGAYMRTTDAGATWSGARYLPCSIGGPCPIYLGQVSCPTASNCFLAANVAPGQVWSSTDGGASFALSFDVANDPEAFGGNGLKVIDCPSAMVCHAAGLGQPPPGAEGMYVTTTNGGLTWRTDFGPTSTYLSGISCPSTSTCYVAAAVSAIFHTADFGGTWDVQVGAANAWYWSVACVSDTKCFAGGTANGVGLISVTTTAGAAWSRPQPVGSTNGIGELSCGSATDCYAAASNDLLVSHNGGSTWAANRLTTGDQLIGMSCTSATTCFASGWPGAIDVTTDSGVNWTNQPNPLSGSDETLSSISCWTSTACVAVSTNDVLSTADGTNWTLENTHVYQFLLGVSCSSASSCIAVGANGTVLTRNGGVWTHRASGTTHHLFAVMCPTARTCYAVGDAGTIIVTSNMGATWAPLHSGTTTPLFGINCSGTTKCLATGSGGSTFLTLNGTTWTARPAPTGNGLIRALFLDPTHVLVGGSGGTILEDSSVPSACESTSLSPGTPSPQPVGTTVTFTAISTGCSNPEYKFFLQAPGGGWVAKTPFGGATWNLNTAGLAAGVYGVGVWARQIGSSASYESYFLATYTLTVTRCTAAWLTPTTAPPQSPGASVTFNAAATACLSPEFRFFVLPPGGAWTMKRDYGAGTWAWDTTGLAPGTYELGVWARQPGSPSAYDAYGFTTFAVGSGNCISAGMTSDLSPPQAPGASVVFTATSNACNTPSYQFWLLPPGGAWTVKQPYSTVAGWTWNTTGLAPGTYQTQVWARQVGSTAAFDAYYIGTFQVAVPSTRCIAADISASPPSPQNAGTSITFTASSTGCTSPQYEFWSQAPGGAWTIVRPYNASNTFTWGTSLAGRNLYRFGVWVRAGGSAARYDSYALTSFITRG